MAWDGLLVGAGFVAGAMNAVAGGGTFVTLPALTLAGLPPTMGNASSTVALFPATLASSWAYRRDVRPLEGVATGALLTLSLTGGLIGALLLLSTPESAFTRIVPWLLLVATIALALGPRLGDALRSIGLRMGRPSLFIAQFVLGIYGGYFGGAVGLMILAVWTVYTSIASSPAPYTARAARGTSSVPAAPGTVRIQHPAASALSTEHGQSPAAYRDSTEHRVSPVPADLRSMTPLRVLMVAAANGIAVICFALSGNIRWRETMMVMAGGIAGGYLGARAGRRLPAPVIRALILGITIITTAAFFLRAHG